MNLHDELRELYPEVCVIEAGLIDLIRSSGAGLPDRRAWNELQARLAAFQKRFGELRIRTLAGAEQIDPSPGLAGGSEGLPGKLPTSGA